MSHPRLRAKPSPKPPPPIFRSVIATPHRGHTGASPRATCSRTAFCSALSNCARSPTRLPPHFTPPFALLPPHGTLRSSPFSLRDSKDDLPEVFPGRQPFERPP